MTPLLSERLREDLASLEHEQWMNWAGIIMSLEPISADRRIRWEEQMVPYAELREAAKEPDREWADQVLNVINPEVEALEAKLNEARELIPEFPEKDLQLFYYYAPQKVEAWLKKLEAALGEDET